MSSEPSLRDKLSASFIAAFESDFAANGAAVIEKLREKYPQHYVEIGARLIAATQEPDGPTNFSNVQSMEDIGRKLLEQIGVNEFAMTDDMIQRAVEANDRLVDELARIADLSIQ